MDDGYRNNYTLPSLFPNHGRSCPGKIEEEERENGDEVHKKVRRDLGIRGEALIQLGLDFEKLALVLPHSHKSKECSHKEILHKGHVDYLWGGYLVHFTPEGRVIISLD